MDYLCKVSKMVPHSLKILYMMLLTDRFKAKSFGRIRRFGWNEIGKENLEAEFLLLEILLKPGDVFADIGANIGQYTDLASRYTDISNILVFEPNPDLFKRLKILFKGARIFNLALSGEKGKAQFNIPIHAGKIIDTRGSILRAEAGEYKTIEVLTDTLDNIVEKSGIQRMDLIKIDVEGFENFVISGAPKTISMYKPKLIIELDSHHGVENIELLLNQFWAWRYSVYYFQPNGMKLNLLNSVSEIVDMQKGDDRGISKSYINNFIFIPSEIAQKNWIGKVNEWIINRIN